MKIITQLGIILLIWYLAGYLSFLLKPLILIPASIIGLLLLFVLLLTKIIKLEDIQELSDFLLGNIAFFFVPAGVGVLHSLDILRTSWVQLLVINLVSTVLVMIVSAYVTNFFSKKEGEENV